MKIGIMGAGMMVSEVLKRLTPNDDFECAALRCRDTDIEKAERLKEQFDIPVVYTELDEFLRDKSFDTVYVCVVNSMHYPYTKRALAAGKNVICEKPFTSTGAEARELTDLAISKGLFLFEAVALRYTENYSLIRNTIEDLGAIKLVHCNYSRYSSRYAQYLEGIVLPVFDPILAGGCLYDINIYNIHFAMGLFGMPKSYEYLPNLGYNGIDTSGVMVLDYGDFKAVCSAAKDSNGKSACTIQGDRGFIFIDSVPGSVNNITVHMNGKEEKVIGHDVDDLIVNEFMMMFEIITAGDHRLCYEYLEQTCMVMNVVENARKRSGILFG